LKAQVHDMEKLLILAVLLCFTTQFSYCAKKEPKTCYDGSEIIWWYKGKMSTTLSGKTCQRWDSNTPHNLTRFRYNARHFPEKTKKAAANYCRDPMQKKHPWCYTTDPKKKMELCEFPLCKGLDNCYFRDIETYKGKLSKTVSGKSCLRWDSAEVKKLSGAMFRYYTFTTDVSLKDASNYCRQPVSRNATLGFKPWCFIGTKKRPNWEFCDVDHCPDKCSPIVKNVFISTHAAGMIYHGKGKKKSRVILKDSQEDCIKACKNTPGCYRWAYITTAFRSKKHHKQCYMMRSVTFSKKYRGINAGSRFVC